MDAPMVSSMSLRLIMEQLVRWTAQADPFRLWLSASEAYPKISPSLSRISPLCGMDILTSPSETM